MVQVLWSPAEVDVRSGLTGTASVDQLAVLDNKVFNTSLTLGMFYRLLS